jgi:hypothetical protein
VRLAIRVESYGRLVVEQRHRVGRRQVDAKQTNLKRNLGMVWDFTTVRVEKNDPQMAESIWRSIFFQMGGFGV